ncbi:MAG: homoserine kinase [Candidatus Obscuribacterales bacterium]|nr:homoserine kinase [Candidatus Obscuribacterales bacterium]
MKTTRRLTLRIPGSTSNLGPGFDTCALALSVHCKLTFDLLEKNDPNVPLIGFSGPIANSSRPEDAGNLIYKMMNELWKDDKNLLDRIRIHIDSDIPLGSGLGSSAACILGALWAAHVFKDRIPTTGSLLAQATSLEGHSESLAASLMGKFVITSRSAFKNSIIARQHDWPEAWRTLFVIPKSRMRTVDSRSVLPAEIPFRDAVANISRTALLVSAVTTCDENTLKEALYDRIHEQYREKKLPLFTSLKKALYEQPILGCVLSGGGPSMCVIVHERHLNQVFSYLNEWAATEVQPPLVLNIPPANYGVQEVHEDKLAASKTQ